MLGMKTNTVKTATGTYNDYNQRLSAVVRVCFAQGRKLCFTDLPLR